MDRVAGRHCADIRDRAHSRLCHAASRRTLLAAHHHRLGHGDLLQLRQFPVSRVAWRHWRHPADFAVRLQLRRAAEALLHHLDLLRPGAARRSEPAEVAAGPRHPRAPRRQGHVGKSRHRCVLGAALGVHPCRRARRHRRMAVCAYDALRQSGTVRTECRYRISADGGARRRRHDRRRGGRRGVGRTPEELAAGSAAASLDQRCQSRDRGVRLPVHPAAAQVAQRHGPADPPVSAATGASRAGGRRDRRRACRESQLRTVVRHCSRSTI